MYSDGDTYEGDCKGNKPHGMGKYKDKLGDVYEGSFKEGKKEGYGRVIYADGS